MGAIYNLVQGRTAPLDFWLDNHGEALDAAGYEFGILAYDKNNEPVTMPGTVSLVAPNPAKVRYTPASATDLLHANSPMKIRWTITVSGVVDHAPYGEPDKWIIRLP